MNKGRRLWWPIGAGLVVLAACSASPWAPNEELWRDTTPVDWILSQQNPEGSFGVGRCRVEGLDVGPVGITGIVLLAVSHHGTASGARAESVRLAVDWLLKEQTPDGTFRGITADGLDQAIATCALLDRLEFVADARRVRDPALKALSAVMSERLSDGTWGSRLRTSWALMALDCARFEEVPHDEKARAEVMEYLDREFDRDPDFSTAWVPLIRHFRGSPELRRRSLPWVTLRPPDARHPRFSDWHLGSIVVFTESINPEQEWRRWTVPLQEALEWTCREGHWPGRDGNESILRTAAALQCVSLYWASRHREGRNVFKSK